MTMQRDYFTTPIQGSRSAHDYGNSNCPFEVERRISGAAGLLIAMSVSALMWVVGYLVYRWLLG